MAEELWQLDIVTHRALHHLRFRSRRSARSCYQKIQRAATSSGKGRQEFKGGDGSRLLFDPTDVSSLGYYRLLAEEQVDTLRQQQIETLRLEANELRKKEHQDTWWKGGGDGE